MASESLSSKTSKSYREERDERGGGGAAATAAGAAGAADGVPSKGGGLMPLLDAPLRLMQLLQYSLPTSPSTGLLQMVLLHELHLPELKHVLSASL